jgi:hypothetical protein
VRIKFPQGFVEVDLTFADLVKLDGDSPADSRAGLDPHSDDLSHPTPQALDPVGGFFQKEVEVEQQTTVVDFDIRKAILSAADSRDREPSSITLHKNSLPDWSWSSPVPADTPLGKRGHGTARERFRRELEKFFAGHSEEYEEAASIAAEALSEELSTIESEAA